jgi:glutaminase
MMTAALVAAAMVAAPAAARAQTPAADIDAALQAAYAKYQHLNEGKNADYIPALAKVDPNVFGIALVTVDGKVYTMGDIKTEVSIQSISKVFTMALVMEESGVESIPKNMGVDATGQVFNSILAIEQYKGAEMNAMVNPGAITATSMVRGSSREEIWKKILSEYSEFAGRTLTVNHEVFKSESDTNQRNQAIAMLMYAYGHIKGEHRAVLGERQRERPGDDGGHPGQRRQESGYRQAGDQNRERAGDPGRDGNGRAL